MERGHERKQSTKQKGRKSGERWMGLRIMREGKKDSKQGGYTGRERKNQQESVYCSSSGWYLLLTLSTASLPAVVSLLSLRMSPLWTDPGPVPVLASDSDPERGNFSLAAPSC